MEIYILRHGLAADAHGGMRDADRPLTPEGAKKLQPVLRRARAIDVRPQVILTSPYRRAREWAPGGRLGRTWLRTVASTTFISYSANGIPRQIRLPPPNGNHSCGPNFRSRNRSGRNWSGLG